MTKKGEKSYFDKIGVSGIDFTVKKPFSDIDNVGPLLSDISAIFSLMPKRQNKIIDLGCGTGWTSNFYALAGNDVVGVDISKTAIKEAQSKFGRNNLKFEVCDYDSLKYKDYFDIAIFNDSLHHADDEVRTLKAVYKTLKPDGIIILCEPGRGHAKSLSSIEAVNKYDVNERDMPPRISKKALRIAGYKNIKIYTHPSKLHNSQYKTFSGYKKFFNNPFGRLISTLLFSTILKMDHGIITAKK